MDAGIVLEHDLMIVICNVENYRDIPGLQLYKLAA
jgi:hypothetical protein